MKLSTSTLGCPDWDLDTILANCKAYGYDAIDFRGLQADLDITKSEAFTTGLSETRKKIADSGLAVSGISSSLTVCDKAKREANLEEARRTIPLALELNVPHVRIFGGGDPKETSLQDLAAYGAEVIHEVLQLDGARELRWCMETHDRWSLGAELMRIMRLVDDPAVGVLWDTLHTIRHGETPEESAKLFGGRLYYTHFKDAVPEEEWRLVSLGDGNVDIAGAVSVLKAAGYDGYLTLEHEKRWHPIIDPPEVAFPTAVKWFREQLSA